MLDFLCRTSYNIIGAQAWEGFVFCKSRFSESLLFFLCRTSYLTEIKAQAREYIGWENHFSLLVGYNYDMFSYLSRNFLPTTSYHQINKLHCISCFTLRCAILNVQVFRVPYQWIAMKHNLLWNLLQLSNYSLSVYFIRWQSGPPRCRGLFRLFLDIPRPMRVDHADYTKLIKVTP